MESGLTRRQMLQAGVAAGAVAFGSDPLVQMANAAITPPLGKLSDIEHVIILIQENRSFDHYFGTYSGVEGFGEPAAKGGLRTGRLRSRRLRRQAAAVPPGNGNNVAQCFPDITHSWVPQHNSWDGGAMDKFVRTHLESDGVAAGVGDDGLLREGRHPLLPRARRSASRSATTTTARCSARPTRTGSTR